MTRTTLAFLIALGLLGAVSVRAHAVFDHPVGPDAPALRRLITALQAKGPVLRAFAQDKHVRAFKRPLHSTGLLAVDPTGVCLATRHPIASTLLVRADGVVHKTGSGAVRTTAAKDNLQVRHFVRIMLALFGADITALSASFDLYFTRDEARWHIGLKPKSRVMAKVLTSIVITGNGDDVGAVTITEANGDTTTIAMTPAPPGAALTVSDCVR